MTLAAQFAEVTTNTLWLDINLLIPVCAGVVGGMGVVGLIHFVLRPRKIAQAQLKEEKQADPFDHGSTSEKRRSFRRNGNPVSVFVNDLARQGQPVRGLVINRSVGGLCLQLDGPIDLETQLSVRPTNAPHIAPWVEVVVKNCREGDIGFEVGCQFIKTPPWPVLMMFG